MLVGGYTLNTRESTAAHMESPDSAITDLLLLPTKNFSQLSISTASLRHTNATTSIFSLLEGLSLWILKHLVGYISNYSFHFLSRMLSLLAPPVIQLFMPHSNQFSETVLMSQDIQEWLYWKINFKNC